MGYNIMYRIPSRAQVKVKCLIDATSDPVLEARHDIINVGWILLEVVEGFSLENIEMCLKDFTSF
jgi:hypothetical protein